MRLEPSEESMYRRMDLKDHMLMMIPVLGMVSFLGIYLLAFPRMVLPGAVVLSISVAGIGVCLWAYIWLKHRIIPLTGCFLEVQTTCFVAVQACCDNQYESCRLFYKDVEELVKGRKDKGFYIRISESGESVIQGKESDTRRIMFISPFGYSKEGVQKIYEVLKKRGPATAGLYERLQ